MTPAHHYIGLKITTLTLALVGAAVVGLDPTIKVAIIVAIPSAITGIGTMILGYLNRQDAKVIRNTVGEMKFSVDGNLSKLLDEKGVQSAKLSDISQQLAHASGRREGVEAAENKAEDKSVPK